MAECPYVVGNTVTVELDPPFQETVDLRITHLFEPFTLSCTMIGQLDRPPQGLERSMVLKIFDRRFATQLRKSWKASPWSSSIEQEYHQFIEDGGISNFIARLKTDKNFASEEGDNWNIPQDEAFLQNTMQSFYNTETEAYEILKDAQGKDIPRLLAHFKVSSNASTSEHSEIRGIALQHVHGFPLNELRQHSPQGLWQSTCEDAIRLVHLLTDHGILNEDVKTRNFIVQQEIKDSGRPKFHVLMIDFASCRFRREFENDDDWWRSKAHEDEEGAVGVIMQRKYVEGGFIYRPSALSEWLSNQYMREE